MTDLNPIFADAASKMKTLVKTPTTLEEVGLSATKMLSTEKDFLQYTYKAIVHYMDLNPTDPNDFAKAINEYLKNLGISNKKIMGQTKDFPAPTYTGGREKQITPAIWQALQTLANSVSIVRKEKFYVDDKPEKVDFVIEWAEEVVKSRAAKLQPKLLPPIINPKKFPTLDLQKFTTFDGDVSAFLEAVKTDFTEKGIISFLKDEAYAQSNLDTSELYCCTLFKSLMSSPHDYLISEHKNKFQNSAKLWDVLQTKLTTNASEMGAIDAQWTKMQKLKCNSIKSFSMFYSDYIKKEN